MKSIDQMMKTLNAFEQRYGLAIAGAAQLSPAWFGAKLGVISASNASKVVAKRDSDTRATYMAQLVAQVCTGVMEEINAKAIEWGRTHEDAARSHYEFMTGTQLAQLPFVFKDESFREGCSPDGILPAVKGAEIKCPFNTEHYIKFLCSDKIKPEYEWQYQYTMRILETDSWDFVQYDPRMHVKPMHILTVKRDEEKQKAFDDLVPQFIADMDKMLAKIGVAFGDQWVRVAAENARVGA